MTTKEETGPVYEEALTIGSSHVNVNRILRTSTLLRLLQDISTAQTEMLGVRRDKTLDRGLLWVVSRQYLEISRMPAYGEQVLLSTEPSKIMHLFFPRFYYVCGALGEQLISGEALWLLMKEDTRTAVVPPPADIRISGVRKATHVLSGSLRPPEGLHLLGESTYCARFSQLDFNGHIGNTHYFDIIEDLLPAADTANTPKKIQAEYRAEILPGEEIRILFSSDGDRLRYFEGISEDTEDSTPKIRFRILLSY